MDPSKLDRQLLRQYVDKYGYDDIAAELDKRDGWPIKEEDNLTGGVPLDDYAACDITKSRIGSTSTSRRIFSAARPTTG